MPAIYGGDHSYMFDALEEKPSLEQPEALDAYGDVALGVECAWPTADSGLLPQAPQQS